MRVLVAPTAFKGTLTALEAARALADGWRSERPGDDLIVVPIGDGGDGSLDMLESAIGAARRTIPARDAFGRVHDAPYAVLGEAAAFVESAAIAGIARLDPLEHDVMRASTAGVGDMIRHLAEEGMSRIAVGVGGTSSHDVGIGMMAVLGARFEGADGDLLAGRDLHRIRAVDLEPVRDLLGGVNVVGVCDVACRLYGPGGAAERFAPQKGASVDQVAQLDRATRAFSQAAGCATGKRLNGLKYGGAGGGLAAGLHLGCIARLVGGLDWLVRKCGLVRIVKGVDLVITGEGRFDETSLQGKAAYRLLEIAAGEGKPVLLASGICNVPVDRLRDLGFRAWASAADPHSGDGDHGRSVARLGAQLAGALARAAITRTP